MIKIHCVFSSNGLWKYSGGVNINLFFNLSEIEICLLSRMTLNQVFRKDEGGKNLILPPLLGTLESDARKESKLLRRIFYIIASK